MLKPPVPFCILNKFHFSSDFELPKFELIHFIFQNLNSQSTGMISDRLQLISTIAFRVLNRLTKKINNQISRNHNSKHSSDYFSLEFHMKMNEINSNSADWK